VAQIERFDSAWSSFVLNATQIALAQKEGNTGRGKWESE
jgi:hypothetical protein